MPQSDAADDVDAQLDAIAAELYALPPAEFTAARNARAAASDPALAKRVKALRKATVAAWTVNLLAREGQLAEAVELSAALREAQDDLDSAELSRLGRQRRALVAGLASQAVELARSAGVAVSGAARDDVEKTINAAVVDASAAAAVLTARLVAPLEAGDIEPGALAEAVGGSIPGAEVPPVRDDLAERRARKAAEKAVREAERLANEADRELARIDARQVKAQERADHIAERIEDLRRDLARLEEEASEATAKLAGLDEEHARAKEKSRTAGADADRAKRTLDTL